MKLLKRVRATALAVLLTGASSAFAESPRRGVQGTMAALPGLYPDKAPKTVENFLQYANKCSTRERSFTRDRRFMIRRRF